MIGRFYSNDPIGFRDVYSFDDFTNANNNPYKYVDPDGREVRAVYNNSSGKLSMRDRDTKIRVITGAFSGGEYFYVTFKEIPKGTCAILPHPDEN